MTRAFGYLRDPEDSRDHPFSLKLGSFAASPPPPSAILERADVRPKDQGTTSSCTGQAVSQAVRLAFLNRGVPCPELSALDVYYRGRAEYGGQGSDDGSYLRSVIGATKQGGIADERAWPFSEYDVNRNPNMLARQSAFDRKGTRGYYRIDGGDIDGVRRAIAAGYPVVGGWQVGQAFLDWNGQGVISGQVMPIGGHAMPIVSYAADGTFRLLNSWGLSYGRSGYAVVDEMFVSAVDDCWAIEVLP